MKKITLLIIMLLVTGFSAMAQYTFPTVAGPITVVNGSPHTEVINDAGNVAGVPASSTGSYSNFVVTVTWQQVAGNPWSNEADLTMVTAAGNVVIDPATTGGGSSNADTTLTFEGDFAAPYDPAVDGQLEIILNQSFGGSSADWSNIIVEIFESPTCIDPSNLTASSITSSSVEIGWQANSGEANWEYVIQPAGTGVPTGAGTATTTNPHTDSTLAAATDYEVYVRADCLTNGISEWVGPLNFTTLCDVFIPDYLQDFTTIVPNCWDEADNGDAASGPTDLGGSSWTDDGFLNNGFTGAYKINLWVASKSDWLLSPQFDLTGGPFQVDFDFGIMEFGSSTTAGTLGSDDTVQLLITTDNGTSWTVLQTWDSTSTVPPTGLQFVYDLTAYSGQTVQFGILGSEGTVDDSEDNDIFVDNFRVRAIPACPEPAGLTVLNVTDTTADIDWTAIAGTTDWEIVIQPAGTGVPTGNGTPTTTNDPYPATGLTATTVYEVYVRTDCGNGLYSTWIGPIEFTTDNTPPPPPTGVTCSSGSSTYVFTEDFEGSAPGWIGGISGPDAQGFWEVPNDSGSTGTGPDNAFNGTGFMNYEASGGATNVATAISPAIDLTTAVDGAELSFYMHAYGADMGTLNVGVSTTPTGPFTILYTWIGDYQTDGADAWVPIGVNLDAYLGQTIYLAFSYGGTGTGWEGDMSIDYVRVEACGNFCIAPTGITVANVDVPNADLSWTPSGSEMAWEYVVQPAGTGVPTGNGTSSATTSVNLSGLDYDTAYEVYVRADCGMGEYSVWAGPIFFTTPIQTVYNIDCDAGPVNITYCYTNNDTTFWEFTSSNGYPLEIVFNSGEIDLFDDMTIYDGLTITDPVLFNNGVAGMEDLTGLTVESTGDTISIGLDTSGFTSCDTSSFLDSWDFDVICKTCFTHSVAYEIRGECEDVQEYFVDVTITDMGDATALTLSDGTTTQPATMVDQVVTFGPYPPETPIFITTTNDSDASCETVSGILNFFCPPPPSECSTIYAGDDTAVCDGTSVNLSASYHVLGQDTNTYEINALDSCPQPPASGGSPTSVDVDDRWSDIIDLSFDFCFFGETYNQILIGANGVVSFDLSNATDFNGWNIDTGDTLPNATNASLSEANIFGVAHDIDPSVCGDINYFILGSAPARQFVINYTDVCHFSCNELTSSSQIILYEGSNAIDINIFNKPTCTTWNEGNAVVGVQNPDDTIAFTPPGRNTGVWDATDEFWRFTPSAGAPDYTLEWFDEDDNSVGTGDSVTVTPTETTTYTAAITYNQCDGTTTTLTDNVLVEILPNPIPVPVDDDIYVCTGTDVTLEVTVDVDDPSTLTYYWTYPSGIEFSGPENTHLLTSTNIEYGEFIVTVIDDSGCYNDTIITVTEGVVPQVSMPSSYNKCINEDTTLEVTVANAAMLSDSVMFNWYLNGELVQSSPDNTYTHLAGEPEGPITVEVIDELSLGCDTETSSMIAYYENENCVDIPQGLSPNNDGLNDCLVLDHLEDREDISKAIVFNRYGTIVFELNDYVDQWCGTDQDGEILPVGTYFYIIYFNSDRDPIKSWIYLNY